MQSSSNTLPSGLPGYSFSASNFYSRMQTDLQSNELLLFDRPHSFALLER